MEGRKPISLDFHPIKCGSWKAGMMVYYDVTDRNPTSFLKKKDPQSPLLRIMRLAIDMGISYQTEKLSRKKQQPKAAGSGFLPSPVQSTAVIKSIAYLYMSVKGLFFQLSGEKEIRSRQASAPEWSECRESNPRPLGPEPSAIPNFATPR